MYGECRCTPSSSNISRLSLYCAFRSHVHDRLSPDAWNSKALPTLLFAVGVINNIQIVAWRQFLIHGAINGQGLNPAEQAFLGSVISGLPWNLKIFVAFASDVLPICGYRRLTYMAIGFILQGGGWLLLGFLGGSASLSVISAQVIAPECT